MPEKSCFLVWIENETDVFHKHNCEDVHGTEAGFLDNLTLSEAVVEWVNGVLRDNLKPHKLAFCSYCEPQLED